MFVYSDADDSVFRVESIFTSCLITRPKLVQDCMLRTSSGCSMELLFYLINWEIHLQLAVFLHLCCSCRLTSFVLCIEHAAFWEKWLITITSSAGSHRLILLHTLILSPSLSLHPSLPSCLLPFPFLFNFTRDQCCCQAIYLFRVVPRTKGPQKATAALPQIWPAGVNFQSKVSSWQWQVALNACGE